MNSLLRNFENNTSEQKTLVKNTFDRIKNAILYDASGLELEVFFPESDIEGSKVIRPLIRYDREFDTCIFLGSLFDEKELNLPKWLAYLPSLAH